MQTARDLLTSVPRIRSRSSGWTTWGRTHHCVPARFVEPADAADLRAALATASARSERVKVAGSGHAANGAALTTGTHVSLRRMCRPLAIDREQRTATVEGGMRLARLNALLAKEGLAIASLGDIDRQTVAGAMATGTHGTSVHYGPLSSQAEAMTVMLADGSVVRCSAEVEPELFRAIRTGIGAIGIVLDVTLRCVPAFRLHQRMWPVTHEELEANLAEWLEEYPYFDFIYDFRSDTVLARSRANAVATSPIRPRRDVVRDDWLVQLAYRGICRFDRAKPDRFDRHVARLPASSRADCVDRSDRLFVLPQLIKLISSEWAVRVEQTLRVMREIGEVARDRGVNPGYGMQIRFTGEDDSYLSPAYGRRTGWINLIAIAPMPWQEYLGAGAVVARAAGARPHWGKWHDSTSDSLRPLYPGWEEFAKVRAAADPEGRFANAYLDSVLGPVTGQDPLDERA